MLDPKGNTGVYLLYAYVRICSILRKAGYDQSTVNVD
jgi:arginyl-tRNA synthetase